MKSLKKLLSFVLATVMLVSMIAGTGISVSAANSGKCGDNVSWSLSDGKLTISGTGDMYDYGDPDQGDEPAPWFSASANITSIVIGNGVTSVGTYAFSGLDNVNTVTIPDSVDLIAEGAFAAMSGLTEVVIPEGVAVIDYYAFSNCASLESVTFPSTLEQIFDGAFQGCMALKSVDLSDAEGLRRIGTRAFSTCINLATAKLPDNVTYMGDYVFHKESYYQPVEVTCTLGSKTAELVMNGSQNGSLSGVKAYGTCGDDLGWYLTDSGILYVYGSGEMYNYGDAEQDEEPAPWYDYYKDIKSIVIGDDVTSVGTFAFAGLSYATDLTIGNSVKAINDCAFGGSGLKTLVVPEGVETIGYHAFGFNFLESVVLPSTLKSIGERAFANNVNLTSVVVPEGLTSIGERAFGGCNSLAEITLPGSITEIGDAIFYKESYYDATKVTCPAGSKIAVLIDNGWQCGSLVIAPVDGVPSGKCGNYLTWAIAEDGTLYIYGSGDMYNYGDPEVDGLEVAAPWYDYELDVTKIVIGDGVTSIGDFAFGVMPNVTEVVIGDSVNTIGAYSFPSFSSLTELVIPEGVTVIGEGAFNFATSLTSVTLPSTLEEIGKKAFWGCKALANIDIPEGVTTIGAQAFASTALTEVVIPGSAYSIGANAFDYSVDASGTYETWTWVLEDGVLTISGDANEYNFTKAKPAPWATAAFKDKFSKLVVEEGTEILGNYAFRNCTALETVVLPESLKEINWYTFALTALKEVVLPDGVTNIGMGAFKECTALENVELSESLAALSSDAFYGCTSLKTIKIPANVVFFSNVADNYFGGCDLEQLTIYCKPDSPAEAFAIENNIKYEYYDVEVVDDTPVLSVDEYTVTITNGSRITAVRYALGEYTTGSEVKWADGCVTLSAAKIAAALVDGDFVHELPDGGFYTFWLKLDDGSEMIIYVDATAIVPYVSLDGVRITIGNLYGVKDINIAKGECSTFDEIRANRLVHISETRLDGKKSYMYEDITKEGTYTVCIRFDDGRFYYEVITIDVLNPYYTLYGLQATIGNLEGVKLVRTAYGTHTSVSDMKKASGYRTFAKKYIKGANEYMIQYREGGTVTVAVHYENGYTEYMHITLTKIVPTYTAEGNTVTIGNLDRVVALRYAPGTFTSSSALKKAPGMRVVTPEKIEDGTAQVTLNAVGKYTFYAIYDDESESFCTVTVE